VALVGWLGAWVVGGCGEEAGNSPPEFLNVPAEIRAEANEALEVDVAARDPDGDAITLEMKQAPSGASFVVSGFGRFVWTPSATDAAPEGARHDVVFEAQDSKGAKSSFRMVVIVSPSNGEARFTTSNNRVLDLSRSESLVAPVSIQADHLTQVPLTLLDAPSGMTLEQTSAKAGELRWTPNAEQISQKLIWGARLQADTGGEAPTEQSLTVTLVAKNCGEGATTIVHTPLGDQRDAGDYLVQADISATDSAEATLFWRLGGNPNDSGGFEGAPMRLVGDLWQASIPNPKLQGEAQDIYYFIVAFTPQEREVGCVARSPATGLNSFAAFEPGDGSCRTDAFEPNEDVQAAQELSETTEGVTVAGETWELYGLALCEDDTDVYSVELRERQGVRIILAYTSDVGAMHLRGFGPDGGVITESDDSIINESSILLPAASDGRYSFEVTGTPQGYRLFLRIVDDVDPSCVDNTLEPNDDADDAPNLPAGEYDNLTICPEDQDYFGVTIPNGSGLVARAFFRHADGDIDLVLRDVDGEIVAQAVSSDDDEELLFANNSGRRNFVLLARGIEVERAVPYRLELEIEEGAVEACDPDFFEPNDDPEQSQLAPIDGGVEGFGASMCGDDDHYAVNVTAGTPIFAQISFDPGVADLDMEILDLHLQRVDSSATQSGSESVEFEAQEDGLHFVRVFRSSARGVPDYELTITVDGSGGNNANNPNNANNNAQVGECADADTNEPNNSENEAVFLDLDVGVQSVGLCQADEDWYVFTASPNQSLLADLFAVPLDGFSDPAEELLFELISDNGSVIAEAAPSGQFLSLDGTIINSRPHFLRVTHFGGSEGFLYDIEAIVF
jgi:hypothetical protein